MTSLYGRVKSAGLDRFGFHVSVADVQQPAPGFVLVTLVGEGLGDSKWHAGDRVSLRTPEDELRNYTPFDWDNAAGSARLLGVGLASGPGTHFLNSLTVGNQVQVIGPKKSINLDLELAPIIVGDETVLGLCAAWNNEHPTMKATVVLEAANSDACRAASQAIDVTPHSVVGDRDALITAVIELARANPTMPLILSGRTQTIAAVRRALKSANLQARPTTVRAYWDENRAGLD